MRAGRTWSDRVRIGMYWVSPYCFGHRAAKPKLVHTNFLEQRSLYLRPASNDVRVLRNVFEREDSRLLDPHPGVIETVLDLGAYTGLTALYFAARYPEARILAVEPDAENFACLTRNISSAAEKDRITMLNACISDQPGHERMITSGPQWERSIMGNVGTQVQAITVCDAIDILGGDTVDLLKMDIEGAEQLAFKSAADWLPRVRWILLEVHGEHMSLEEVRTALAASGRNRMLKRSDTPGRWIELDDASIRKFQEQTKRVDLLIPPPD